jgi:hypothetical protein
VFGPGNAPALGFILYFRDNCCLPGIVRKDVNPSPGSIHSEEIIVGPTMDFEPVGGPDAVLG